MNPRLERIEKRAKAFKRGGRAAKKKTRETKHPKSLYVLQDGNDGGTRAAFVRDKGEGKSSEDGSHFWGGRRKGMSSIMEKS